MPLELSYSERLPGAYPSTNSQNLAEGSGSSCDKYNGKSISKSDDPLQPSSISPSLLAIRASITVNSYATMRYPATAFPVGFEAQIDEIHLTYDLLHG